MAATLDAAHAGTRWEKLTPILAGLAVGLPNVLLRYPPMVDLPFHEGIVSVLRHFHDPAWFPQGLYLRNFGHGNQLFYLLAWPLSYLLGVELACTVVVGASVFAVVYVAGTLAAHLGASRWAALLLAPVTVGWMYYWGLIGNIMGLAALLAMLPPLDRLAEAPSAKRALAATAGCLLLYETHELMLILYCGAALIFAAGHELRVRSTLLRISPFLFGLTISLVEHFWATSLVTPVNQRTPLAWAPVFRKLYTVPDALFGGLEPEFVYSTTAIVVLALALLLVARYRAPAVPRPPGLRRFIRHYRFELFGLASFALYVGLPADLHAATLVYHRFVAPAYAMLVVCAGPRGAARGLRRTACFVASAAPVAALAGLFPLITDVSNTAGNLDVLMAEMQQDAAVAVVGLGPRSRELRNSAIASMGARVLTKRGGRLLFAFMVSPIAPVIYDPKYDWDEPVHRTLLDHYAFRPAHDFKRFRYALVHSTSAALTLGVVLALRPDARFVDTAGDWTLFESRLPLEPILSPDVPLPTPPPPTLRTLLKRLASSVDAPLQPADVPEPDAKQPDDGVRLAPRLPAATP
jgi:hypothetical protein